MAPSPRPATPFVRDAALPVLEDEVAPVVAVDVSVALLVVVAVRVAEDMVTFLDIGMPVPILAEAAVPVPSMIVVVAFGVTVEIATVLPPPAAKIVVAC